MVRCDVYSQIDVSIPNHQYPVIICHNGLSDADLLHKHVPSQQVLIVTNHTVAPYYLRDLQSIFAEKQCDVVILPDGEEYKNQHSLVAIYDSLIQNSHHRDTTVIALGGGVVGDLAGFAASTYQRGVRLVQIPTTLLAQVDASVGGKTAINHPLGKNMIGSFHQPGAVLIDLNTLRSLPDREFRAGLAEMIKYALLEGGQFLLQLTRALEEGLTFNSPQLPDLISQCCQIKAKFVVGDEKEQGQRALLNLGHTFAHALEAHTYYQKWLHGEAVAIGLYCASLLSRDLGLLESEVVTQIEQILIHSGLTYKIPREIDLDQVLNLMSLDKKIKNNCLRFVLIKKPGDCYLDDTITQDRLLHTLTMAVEGE